MKDMDSLNTPETKFGTLISLFFMTTVLLSFLYLPAVLGPGVSASPDVERVYAIELASPGRQDMTVYRRLPSDGNTSTVVASLRAATQERLIQIEQDTGRNLTINPPEGGKVTPENLTDKPLNISSEDTEFPPRFVLGRTYRDFVQQRPELRSGVLLYRDLNLSIPSGEVATYGVLINVSDRAVLRNFDLSSREALIVSTSYGQTRHLLGGHDGPSGTVALASHPSPDVVGRRAHVGVEGRYRWSEYHAWLGPRDFTEERPVTVYAATEFGAQLRSLPHRLFTPYGLLALVASVVLGQAALRGWRWRRGAS